MATKHGKVVNLHENHQTINPHNPLNMCSQEVTWQTKNIISPQDLSKRWHTPRSSNPDISITSQWGHVRSRDKLNTLYLHLQKTHRHQTSQGADLQWWCLVADLHWLTVVMEAGGDLQVKEPTYGAPILKERWLFDHVTNVRSLDSYISTITRFMVSKHGMVLVYGSKVWTQKLKSSTLSCFS